MLRSDCVLAWVVLD